MRLPQADTGLFPLRAKGNTTLDAQGVITGGTNCSPALLAAITAAAVAGGGEVSIPRGKFRLNSPMVIVLSTPFTYGQLRIRGRGSASRLYLDAATHAIAIDGTGGQIIIENLAICGNGNTGDSGYAPIALGSANNLVLREVLFAGLKGSGPNSIQLSNFHTLIESCYFFGSGGPSNTDGLVGFNETEDTTIRHCRFLDIGGPESFASNLNNGAWVYFGEPNHSIADSGAKSGRILIEECEFDESSKYKINIQGSNTVGTGLPYRWNDVELKGNVTLINNTVDPGIIVKCADAVRIIDHRASQSGPADLTRTAIRLIDCRDVFVEGFSGEPLVRRIEVDDLTKSVTFRNCDAYTLVPTGTLPPCYDITNGVKSRWRLSEAPVVANTLVKAGATAGRVDQLGTGDDARLVTGVALDGASGAGELIRVVEMGGQEVQIKSDGATTMAPSDVLTSSGVSAGRVKKTTTGGTNTVGLTTSTVTNVADTLVTCIFRCAQY